MLELKKIVKDYVLGDTSVHALRGVSIAFRECEFVSVLGPSGCGKTTLLNLIGGLDQYTRGDLVINGVSTRRFRDGDWDAYRNHSVGFVFQSYNLIPHQSVLANVELALTLSGVPRAVRRRRAAEALRRVGLGDQLRKRPGQLSGGQMQRVAIARALVNDPDILLADEPTGALDTETSVQIMELLKEVAKSRLVVMVTHNPELAERYSTRIVRLLDGEVTDDSDPYTAPPAAAPGARQRHTSMSFGTALQLSLKNLMTKKTRTLLTAFAGSIGIIGIALILSLSNGIQNYIDRVQEDTLSTYPLAITEESVDMASLMAALSSAGGQEVEHERDAVYSSTMMADLMNSMLTMESQTNDLQAFLEYIQSYESGAAQYLSSVQCSYGVVPHIYKSDTAAGVVQVNPSTVFDSVLGTFYNVDNVSGLIDTASSMSTIMSTAYSMDIWTELLDNEALLHSQYDVVAGRWPDRYDEVVLIVDANNEINDVFLYSLGLKDAGEVNDILKKIVSGEELTTSVDRWNYEELLAKTYRLLLPTDYYRRGADGRWAWIGGDEDLLRGAVENALTLRVVGIIRPSEEAVAASAAGAMGYTADLTAYVIDQTERSAAVAAQRAESGTDIFTGLPFKPEDAVEPTAAERAAAFTAYAAQMTELEQAGVYAALTGTLDPSAAAAEAEARLAAIPAQGVRAALAEAMAAQGVMDAATAASYTAAMTESDAASALRQALTAAVQAEAAQKAQSEAMTLSARGKLGDALEMLLAALDVPALAALHDEYVPAKYSPATLETNLEKLGVKDPDKPSMINLYAATFEDKDRIVDIIEDYNRRMSESGQEEKVISYTDYVGILMSSITKIINVISWVLIAFVSISLVVSSIMIGIITYISVLERTKEIGILRAIGASKRDISRVFNAETLVVGLWAGVIGIGVTLLIDLPASAIIYRLYDIPDIALLPWQGGAALVGISMVLTLVAGLIPSRLAAKKDPVEALRSE